MKTLLALLFAALAVAFAYQYHLKEVRRAAEEAEEATRLAMTPRDPGPTPTPIISPVSISRHLESIYVAVFSNLDLRNPEDYVPVLQITRERVLDHRAKVNPKMQPIYDLGVATLGNLIDAADERTKVLEVSLRNTVAKGALDARTTAAGSGAFFTQTTLKKWETDRLRLKATAEQSMNKLRNAEREWNANANTETRTESYDLPLLTPVMITLEGPTAPSSSLSQGAFARGGTNSAARQRYYLENQSQTYR